MTDSKKRMNIQSGDGIASLIQMALPFVKSALPKIASTIGLAGLSTDISHGINKNSKQNMIAKTSMNTKTDKIEKLSKTLLFPSSALY